MQHASLKIFNNTLNNDVKLSLHSKKRKLQIQQTFVSFIVAYIIYLGTKFKQQTMYEMKSEQTSGLLNKTWLLTKLLLT